MSNSQVHTWRSMRAEGEAMLRGLMKRLFGSPDSSPNDTHRAANRAQAQGSPFSLYGALEGLASSVQHFAQPDNPFLHRDYSPGTRVPCADFTPFIISCLKSADLSPVKSLMTALVSGNPGLGIGLQWAGDEVAAVAAIDYDRYLESDDPDTVLEIKALFIVASKAGGGREFWLTDEKARLFSYALCCDRIHWLPAMTTLRDRANGFICSMWKDTPYWLDYPLFSESSWDIVPPDPHPSDALFNGLPIGARIHLLSLAEPKRGGQGSLLRGTTFAMRDLGVNSLQTADLLLASGLCEPVSDAGALEGVWSKDELIGFLQSAGVGYRRSWSKRQLLDAVAAGAPELVQQACTVARTASVKPEYFSFLQDRFNYAQALAKPLSLLFFA
jgi:hypothetical protein